MNKKNLYIFGVVGSLAVAIVFSYFYAQTAKAWLLVFTGCAVMLLLICVVCLIKRTDSRARQKIYRKKSRYITAAEWDFLHVLRSIVGNRYEVCVQAPLVAVIDKPGSAYRNELFRVVDYLIVNPANYEPLLLVELNDASHNRADRKSRDQKVADICADAQMPLAVFTTAQSRDTAEVRKTILKMLK